MRVLFYLTVTIYFLSFNIGMNRVVLDSLLSSKYKSVCTYWPTREVHLTELQNLTAQSFPGSHLLELYWCWHLLLLYSW